MKWLQGVALVSVTLLCIALTVVAVTAEITLASIQSELGRLSQKVALELDEAHKLTLEAALTAAEARKAFVKESQYLDAWDKGIGASLGNFNEAITDLRRAIATTSTAEAEIARNANIALIATTETITGLQPTEQQLTTTIKNIGTLAANPDLPKVINNMAAASEDIAGAASNIKDTSVDIKQEVHSLTHPKLAVEIVDWTLKGFSAVGNFFSGAIERAF
jgi:hypothetical protein